MQLEIVEKWLIEVRSRRGEVPNNRLEALMYAWIRESGIKKFGSTQVPSLLIALLIAELFYKFHSFVLECVAFLLTWTALNWIQSKVFPARKARTLTETGK
jgi:hypothetical protein